MNGLARLVSQPAFWICVVGLLFGAPLVRGLRAGRPPSPPPILGRFPHFSLRDDGGHDVSSETMRGHAFIANELCIRCGISGTRAAETMRRLQHRARNLGDALHFLSFSSDGDATALTAVRRQRAASYRWILIAGETAEVSATLRPDGGLVLVDGRMQVRGRYPGTTDRALDEALRDVSLILNSE